MAHAIRHNPHVQTYQSATKKFENTCFDGQTNLETSLKVGCGTLIEGFRGDYLDQIEGVFSITFKDAAQKIKGIVRLTIFWMPNQASPASREELVGRTAMYDGFQGKIAFYHELFNKTILAAIQEEPKQESFEAYTKDLGRKVYNAIFPRLKENHAAFEPYPNIMAVLEADYSVVPATQLAIQGFRAADGSSYESLIK